MAKMEINELVSKLSDEVGINKKDNTVKINKYNASTQTYYSDEEQALKNVPQINENVEKSIQKSNVPTGELGDMLETFVNRKNDENGVNRERRKMISMNIPTKAEKWRS